jgi:prevent-host-death family protein
MWSVVDAKAHLSEILRLAKQGEPQVIGSQNPCVVVSLETYNAEIAEAGHDGLWLLNQARHISDDLILPPRSGDRADGIFQDA